MKKIFFSLLFFFFLLPVLPVRAAACLTYSNTSSFSGGTAYGNSSGGKVPSRAFDDNAATAWTNSDTTSDLFYTFATGTTKTINKWAIRFNADGVNPLFNGSSITIAGSNDDVTWHILDTYTASGGDVDFFSTVFVTPTTTAYQRFRFDENNSGSNVGIVDTYGYECTQFAPPDPLLVSFTNRYFSALKGIGIALLFLGIILALYRVGERVLYFIRQRV